MDKIDTIRVILFLECNMKCSYCCNEQKQFSNQFVELSFEEIDFRKYKNVCISGGEPFLNRDVLFRTLLNIPFNKNIYLYTNGTLIKDYDIYKMMNVANLKCVNIGLHSTGQLKRVNKNLEKYLTVRFMVQDRHYNNLLDLYPERLNSGNLKSWKLNECNMPNEDWVLLK